MLSLAGILILENEVPAIPSTFILKGAVKLPPNFMLDILMAWLFLLRTKNALTVEPVVVNTVSNKTESEEKLSLAPLLVITLSFLHENRIEEYRQSASTK